MKIVRYGIFFCSVAICAMIVVVRPEWLADNTFLRSFIGADLLSLLVVILTITFASVANIHLSLNRFASNGTLATRQGVSEIRQEINSNAWMIFVAFVVCLISLLIQGGIGAQKMGIAATDAVCLLVLLVNVLVMHDLYHAIFALASVPSPAGSSTTEVDYNSDSPAAGGKKA